jgi:hypothetical protein
MGGYRYATAVGSDITGFGADEIIIDDPVQPEDALSERVKQQLRDWSTARSTRVSTTQAEALSFWSCIDSRPTISRGPYQDLWARGFRHLLPGESMASSASDNLKIRRFSEGLFSLYDGLVRLPNAMPGRALETLLAEIAAFPDGKHDDQVDALSYVAAYRARVIHEARRWGLNLGRLRPPQIKVQIVPPKSRDQELYDRRQRRQG